MKKKIEESRKDMKKRTYKPYPTIHHPKTLTFHILEKLAELEEAAIDGIFPRKYPEARIWRRLLGVDEDYSFKKESFSALLSRLRAQGLVERSGRKRDSVWRLTNEGRKLLNDTFQKTDRIKSDGIRRIVVFDIPERERKKRDAIRTELISAGFTQLQKSVWYGEQPLPQDFIELIDALQLKSCIHIFSVRDEGTLNDINCK